MARDPAGGGRHSLVRIVTRGSADGGATPASAWLKALITAAADAEEELFSMIPVLGEASSQHAVDDWVDQVVDLCGPSASSPSETELRTNLADGDLP